MRILIATLVFLAGCSSNSYQSYQESLQPYTPLALTEQSPSVTGKGLMCDFKASSDKFIILVEDGVFMVTSVGQSAIPLKMGIIQDTENQLIVGLDNTYACTGQDHKYSFNRRALLVEVETRFLVGGFAEDAVCSVSGSRSEIGTCEVLDIAHTLEDFMAPFEAKKF